MADVTRYSVCRFPVQRGQVQQYEGRRSKTYSYTRTSHYEGYGLIPTQVSSAGGCDTTMLSTWSIFRFLCRFALVTGPVQQDEAERRGGGQATGGAQVHRPANQEAAAEQQVVQQAG